MQNIFLLASVCGCVYSRLDSLMPRLACFCSEHKDFPYYSYLTRFVAISSQCCLFETHNSVSSQMILHIFVPFFRFLFFESVFIAFLVKTCIFIAFACSISLVRVFVSVVVVTPPAQSTYSRVCVWECWLYKSKSAVYEIVLITSTLYLYHFLLCLSLLVFSASSLVFAPCAFAMTSSDFPITIQWTIFIGKNRFRFETVFDSVLVLIFILQQKQQQQRWRQPEHERSLPPSISIARLLYTQNVLHMYMNSWTSA